MIYAFHDCRLDEARRELRRAGEVVAIMPKVFEVLVYLLQHRDRVVPRHELFEQCWPDTFVSDEALTRCLGRVRQAVGDTRSGQPIIKTMPRQGYRFVTPLETYADDATMAQSSAAPGMVTTTEGPPEQLPSPGTASPEKPASASFVGRTQELRDLRTALTETLAGRGQLVLLGGPPGIGKTRTAQEVALYAAEAGMDVFWGRCYEGQGAPPYWPWVQIIRAYITQSSVDQMRLAMGEGAADIAEIVSDVRQAFPDLPSPASREPTRARFRLFDAIATFWQRASAERPRVLVLDNLHAADRASLLLLEFLVQEIVASRVFLLGTYRDVELTRQHPLLSTIGELARVPEFRQLLLRGFSIDDVRHFVEGTAGIEPPPRLVQELYTYTEGNPLFLTEVVRLLIHRGEMAPEPMRHRTTWSFGLPEGVRAVISRRLDILSERCNQLLSAAAVIGREFDLADLVHLDEGRLEADVLVDLEEAAAARIIETVPGIVGRYRFTHALIQQTLLSELTPEQSAQLHAKRGAAMEALYDREVDVVQLAYHFERAAPVVGTAKLVQYALAAGEQALASYAYEEAVAHFELALTVKKQQPMDAETTDLLFGLGRAQVATLPNRLAAKPNLLRAFDYYVQTKHVDKALALIDVLPPGSQLLGMPQMTAQALQLIPADSLQAGWILPRHGLELGRTEGDYEGAQRAFQQALAIAQREQDVGLEMRTLAYAIDVDAHYLRDQEGMERALRAIDLIPVANDLYAEALSRYHTTLFLLRKGEPQRARLHAQAGLAAAETLHDRFRLRNALLASQTLAQIQGHWPEARDFSERAMDVIHDDVLVLSFRGSLEYETGNIVQGKTYVDRLVELLRSYQLRNTVEDIDPVKTIPMVARLVDEVDYFPLAETVATRVLWVANAPPRIHMIARATLALIAVQLGDVASAEVQYAALKDGSGLLSAWGLISLDRILGLLACTLQRFEDAIAFCRSAGYRPELAWSLCDYGDALRQRGGPEDDHKVLPAFEESLAVARDLGMTPLVERVVARIDQAVSPSGPASPHPDGLSRREVEVLRLIASGKTDREIAEALFISVHTVGNHVTHILNKTNTANRTEAATYAARHGLA